MDVFDEFLKEISENDTSGTVGEMLSGLGAVFNRSGSIWKPQARTLPILIRAMEHIRSVEYRVSIRWVFYRLLQEGLYNSKGGYKAFVNLTSRARHAFWNGWKPDLLSDETRAAKLYGHGNNSDGFDPIADIIERLKDYKPEFSHFYNQDYYVELLFEARAMANQFEHYTEGITLCPFGGQPSIPYKWNIAKRIEYCCKEYDCKGRVLYFGDLDDAGFDIYEAGKRDIREWCVAPVEFIRCGLTGEQVEKYGIPENPDHPGYQWEALSDEGAEEIIIASIADFVDLSTYSETQDLSVKIGKETREKITKALKDLE